MIQVLLVDDSTFLREMLKNQLLQSGELDVVGCASSGEEAIILAHSTKPDVVVMDLYLPGISGVQATKAIVKEAPGTRVVILTGTQREEDLYESLEAGACGFVSKESPPGRLVEAIRLAYDGHGMIDPLYTVPLIKEFVKVRKEPPSSPPQREAQETPLTVREIEILYLIGQGKSNGEIASDLVVSEATVKSHVHQLLSKLNMTNRMQLALYANEHQLFERSQSLGGGRRRKDQPEDG